MDIRLSKHVTLMNGEDVVAVVTEERQHYNLCYGTDEITGEKWVFWDVQSNGRCYNFIKE